ncbi:MAG: O-acetylhomoserine aminocarboxypropyltransferase/cysteine synthase [Selenomonadaceae bacterium]|nr:O-acetylhomoserine aminocarboxypropyltransferase/cysteine synthase [Selenomonadaceae bacterium]
MYRFETRAVHAGQEKVDATGARAVPIYQNVSYVFEDGEDAMAQFALKKPGCIYSRLGNPTVNVFEERVASLEGGVAALGFSSGMAAITAVLQGLCHNGEHIVASANIYGGTYNLMAHTLPDMGVTTDFVEQNKGADEFEKAIKENTKCLYVESVGNPNADLIDLEAVAKIAHKHNIPLVVDNTFATPYLLRPIEHGADIVVHSATKFISGNGTALGGVMIDSGNFDWGKSGKFPWLSTPNDSYHGMNFQKEIGKAAFAVYLRAVLLRDTGGTLSPTHAFYFLQGLQTLALRVERHVENALKIVDFLKNHPKVKSVAHPALETHRDHAIYKKYFPKGGVSIFTFEINGTKQDAMDFIGKLKIFSLLANVADAKSLVIHPASTTHGQMNDEELKAAGISPTTIRLSIGIENVEDLIEDLKQALG